MSLTIVAFARSLLSGHIRGQGARAKWREMTSAQAEKASEATGSYCSVASVASTAWVLMGREAMRNPPRSTVVLCPAGKGAMLESTPYTP